MRRAHLTIGGMTAGHHVRAVFEGLAGVPGILRADVHLGGAVVDHDGGATRERLAEAVALAGCELAGLREERVLPVV